MKLLRGRESIVTLFDLLGDKENDMTAGLGFVLARSSVFLERLLKDLTGYKGSVTEAEVRLQTRTRTGAITDVRIDIPEELSVVIEAKRNAQLPSIGQLRKYAKDLKESGAPTKRLVALTNATDEFATAMLPNKVKRIDVVHRSWRSVKELAEKSRATEKNNVKRWLDEFVEYLEGVTQMETRDSNLVYVVSLGSGTPKGWKISWIDIVAKRRRYFYPCGPRWPDPPNYLGFRYWSRLRSIHHVGRYEMFTNPHDLFPEIPSNDWGPHYCFKLGPPIKPPHDVKVGRRIVHAARVWCMLDTLLTCKTISDALTETKRRQRA